MRVSLYLLSSGARYDTARSAGRDNFNASLLDFVVGASGVNNLKDDEREILYRVEPVHAWGHPRPTPNQ